MRPRLVITAPFDDAYAASLEEGFDVRRAAPLEDAVPLVDGPHAGLLADAVAVVCELDVVDERSLDAAPELRVVVSCRANPVNVDLDACRRRGIEVLTTPGRNAEVTADLSFALLLATVRHLGSAERWLRAAEWRPEAPFSAYHRFRGMQLRDRTLGIIGGGAVGRGVARRAAGFGMARRIFDPYLAQEQIGELGTVVELDQLLDESDIVTIHAPLNEATRGLIGSAELERLRPGAYLINAGRAAIVEEDALIAALRDGPLAGAGLDVYWQEPLPHDHPLLTLDNVTLTPHIGGASDDVIVEQSRIAVERLAHWRADRPG